MSKDRPDLSAAYALRTPAGSRKLYADWATDYDQGFADAEDYQLHLHTARLFAKTGATGPILDVGAGTGLCGAALAAHGISPIDATDISAEMLAEAARKDIYRDLIEADLTQGLPFPDNGYAGLTSSGTFTTGHVGPEVFDELLRVARPGAQFALSINTRHFDAAGFAAKLDALSDELADISLSECPIYGPKASGPHRSDTAYVACFRKR
ncbi:class I SAM-dependent methyltransferase [Thalassococcus sp. S3]|uniref:class I SAM-dependent DNA methyltransferase n=1 Tax=Thalassococcus sp. S3 TaxID=2017482 RepID=UPI0010242317|nr:class I SAM-dependent methyltransferase [Thalassococcus sp. S3]QBF29756.1 methyltransferase [Thalassococcus sp. S3]